MKKLNVISGNISKGKQKLIENLTYLYGKYASDYLFAKTQKDKKQISKLMQNIKKEINKLKNV